MKSIHLDGRSFVEFFDEFTLSPSEEKRFQNFVKPGSLLPEKTARFFAWRDYDNLEVSTHGDIHVINMNAVKVTRNFSRYLQIDNALIEKYFFDRPEEFRKIRDFKTYYQTKYTGSLKNAITSVPYNSIDGLVTEYIQSGDLNVFCRKFFQEKICAKIIKLGLAYGLFREKPPSVWHFEIERIKENKEIFKLFCKNPKSNFAQVAIERLSAAEVKDPVEYLINNLELLPSELDVFTFFLVYQQWVMFYLSYLEILISHPEKKTAYEEYTQHVEYLQSMALVIPNGAFFETCGPCKNFYELAFYVTFCEDTKDKDKKFSWTVFKDLCKDAVKYKKELVPMVNLPSFDIPKEAKYVYIPFRIKDGKEGHITFLFFDCNKKILSFIDSNDPKPATVAIENEVFYKVRKQYPEFKTTVTLRRFMNAEHKNTVFIQRSEGLCATWRIFLTLLYFRTLGELTEIHDAVEAIMALKRSKIIDYVKRLLFKFYEKQPSEIGDGTIWWKDVLNYSIYDV